MASPERHRSDGQRREHDPERPLPETSGINVEPSATVPIELTEIHPPKFNPDSPPEEPSIVPQLTGGQDKCDQRGPRLGPESSMSPDAGHTLTITNTPRDKTDVSFNSTPPPLTREAPRPAIGPVTDKHSDAPLKELEVEGPVVYITLLLTTGARHPFRLDQKYLRKRNVEVEGNNPVNMSLYKLKELILRDWRDGTLF